MTLPMVSDSKPEMPNFHVIVKFGKGIPIDAQGPVMMAMEKALRAQKIPAEVFQDEKADDSKLRRNMTDEQRANL